MVTSLLRRILHFNLIVAGVAVVSLTALFLGSYRAEFQRQERLRAGALVKFVARQSEVPALIGDRQAIEKIASRAASAEEVVFVRIEYRGGAGEVMAVGSHANSDSGVIKAANGLKLIGKLWVDAVGSY
jgi:hypothetical protein